MEAEGGGAGDGKKFKENLNFREILKKNWENSRISMLEEILLDYFKVEIFHKKGEIWNIPMGYFN